MSNQKLWDRARVSAFWDMGLMTHDIWLTRIHKNHLPTIKQSILNMRAMDFINLVGKEHFKEQWPTWIALFDRKSLSSSQKERIDYLNASWSILMTGGMWISAYHWNDLTAKQRETFIMASKQYGASIYHIAKCMNRNYKRTHNDIKKLYAFGLVRLKDVFVGQKKTSLVCVMMTPENA